MMIPPAASYLPAGAVALVFQLHLLRGVAVVAVKVDDGSDDGGVGSTGAGATLNVLGAAGAGFGRSTFGRGFGFSTFGSGFGSTGAAAGGASSGSPICAVIVTLGADGSDCGSGARSVSRTACSASEAPTA